MHLPVLLDEVVGLASGPNPVNRIWDATFGRGGHTQAFLERFPEAQIIASDRDPDAIRYGEERFADLRKAGRLQLYRGSFFDIDQLAKEGFFEQGGFDLILMDLGVSSPQLDTPERGFSFYQDGPLDMRMDPTQGTPAHEIVNTWTEVGLQRLFTELGEIPKPHRVTRAIIEDRKQKPFATTRELASLIERVDGWRRKGHHPATQYFMALRLLVNEELDGLKTALPVVMERALRPGGRLQVITFHSLEDRIVKSLFKEQKHLGAPVNKKVVAPSRPEILRNPRARSAKLRVFQAAGRTPVEECHH